MPPSAEHDDFRFAGKRGAEARDAFDAAAKRLRPGTGKVMPSIGPEDGIPTHTMSPLKRWFLGQLPRR